MRVTVAALGSTADNVRQGEPDFTGQGWEDQGPDLRWEQRKRVELEVDESETLASVIDRAAEEFGIGRPSAPGEPKQRVSSVIDGVAFYHPDDDKQGGSPGPFLRLFPT